MSRIWNEGLAPSWPVSQVLDGLMRPVRVLLLVQLGFWEDLIQVINSHLIKGDDVLHLLQLQRAEASQREQTGKATRSKTRIQGRAVPQEARDDLRQGPWLILTCFSYSWILTWDSDTNAAQFFTCKRKEQLS